MMKEEFEALIDGTIDDYEYKVVEYVYANHPLFDSKQKAADAYKLFGVAIFRALESETKKFAAAYEVMREAMVVAECRQNDYKTMVDSLHMNN